MSGLASRIPVYHAFARNAFLEILAYRLRYFTGIITYLLFVSVHYFIWNAVYSGKPAGATINGFTLSEMVTYIAIGWISRSLYYSNVDEEIEELVTTGQISIYLLRPVHFQLMMLAHAAGQSVFRSLFFSLPISVVILSVYDISLPVSVAYFLYFLLATFFAFLILAQINFLVGLLAFSFKSINGVMRAKYYLVQLLGGLLLPLSFFPPAVEKVFSLLPFQAITYVPLRLYLGKIPPSEVLSTFAIEAAWILLLAFLGKVFWERAMSKLTIQGG